MVQTRYSVPAFSEPTISREVDSGTGPPYRLEELEQVKMYPQLKHYRSVFLCCYLVLITLNSNIEARDRLIVESGITFFLLFSGSTHLIHKIS